jgi:hypothetical protein
MQPRGLWPLGFVCPDKFDRLVRLHVNHSLERLQQPRRRVITTSSATH